VKESRTWVVAPCDNKPKALGQEQVGSYEIVMSHIKVSHFTQTKESRTWVVVPCDRSVREGVRGCLSRDMMLVVALCNVPGSAAAAVLRSPDAVCCDVLQCIAVCCSVLQCIAACRSVLQSVAVCCSVLQCVVVCYSVLQGVAVCCRSSRVALTQLSTRHNSFMCDMTYE